MARRQKGSKLRKCLECLKNYQRSEEGKVAEEYRRKFPEAIAPNSLRWPEHIYFIGAGTRCKKCVAERRARREAARKVEEARIAEFKANPWPAPAQKPTPPKVTKAPKRTNDGWWTLYNHYLNSPVWAAFRISVLASRGRKCEQCSSVEGVMHVHHLTYARVGQEDPADVVVLCVPCHEKAHGRKLAK